jgi:Flp pilus assembly protein TadG
MSLIRRAIRGFLVGEDGIEGAALIELSLLVPLLVVMGIYTADFGLSIYTQMQVQNAAQAGVDWAMANHVFNQTAISAAVTNATNNPNATSTLNITVSPGYPIEQCGCPSSTGMIFSADTAPNPCPTCNDGSVGGLYVTVQAQATWNSFIYAPFLLFSNAANTITAQATARIQ